MSRKVTVIRKSRDGDLGAIYSIINSAAEVYKGVIPRDRWKEPYMSEEELLEEVAAGVTFWVYQEGDELVGVMGIQAVQDVTLIRHAYVRPDMQNRGIGGKLLAALRWQTPRNRVNHSAPLSQGIGLTSSCFRVRSPIRSMRIIRRQAGSGQTTRESVSIQSAG